MVRIYGLLAVVELALLVYCLIECVQTPSAQVRNLPKLGWVLLILFFPLVGGIAWLFAGRPARAPSSTTPPAGRRGPRGGPPQPGPPRGPDDDPDFLRGLGHGSPGGRTTGQGPTTGSGPIAGPGPTREPDDDDPPADLPAR
jgi:hypothetical protein